ncbi:MAG: response regulator [bacterium]
MKDNGGAPIRILVVDDEPIVVSLVRDALEDDDYELATAGSGPEALAQIKAGEFNLIITDIRMPEINGIELVQRARAVHPDIFVIFMTGYANLNSAKDAIKQGAFDYILKPFELAEIRRAVAGAVQKLRKDTAEKNPDQQFEKLSDLNQMLLTSQDRSTLSTVSLRFAMMHCRAEYGTVVVWDRVRSVFDRVTIINEQVTEEKLPPEELSECLQKLNPEQFCEPVVLSAATSADLNDVHPELNLCLKLTPNWFTGQAQMIAVPVLRTEQLQGILMVGYPEDNRGIKKADLKFLSIGASQLALSLENLELVEETQTAYAQLRQLQDETIQLEKMATRGEMSAEIGHELNNFLGVVTGNLSLLDVQLKRGNVSEVNRYIHAMIDNVEKMKQFTANLMELTPISSRKNMLYLDKILQEVVEYLKPQRRFQGVRIELAPITQPLPFEADGLHIQQLLYNFFNNAADATADRENRCINVECRTDPGATTFRLSISDNGAGIEPELRAKLFTERFTTKESGHGFGLMVCQRIVENHGGRISVDSTPGTGTTFHIEFPLAERTELEPTVS